MTNLYDGDNDRVRVINGISDLIPAYEFFILDIWGVLHDGIKPFSGTVGALKKLQNAKKQVLLLSNTPDRSVSIRQRLAQMGIPESLYSHVITAGDSAYEDLKTRQGQTCWYAGKSHINTMVSGLDIVLRNNHNGADFIINDLFNESASFVKALRIQYKSAIAKSLPMICANPDLVVQSGNRIYECPGTYAKIYEDMGGSVIYHGKPHRPIYETAWKMLGRPEKSKIVAIGDSLHTDIQGANNFGISSVFNLVGIHKDEIQAQHDGDIEAFLANRRYKPNMVLEGLN